ncbi:hypothetical protein [Mucilaginibacter ginsenosidivorax]|uniref:Uncharacterized protein n=1 Tax=Mucilaginibacter ginsenosidivorax TaxID=862126 RepID=A0A5B8W528_9SPHI|nr:hypothetical protein [Mucilaginibacter ginsenosidivorax]QEC78853.1 hypothetical protein FSB76_23955 [Mucilaginibacter ginsenosidivorax]
MAASLTKIKGFIQTYSGYNFENLSETEFEELKNFVSQALLMVRWEIGDELHQIPDEPGRSQYVSGLQSQLTYMADGIIGFENGEDIRIPLVPAFEWVMMSIFDLLEHIRNYFPDYFDFGAILPKEFISRHRDKDKFWGSQLIEVLTEHHTDPVLIELIKNYNEATDKSEWFKIKTWRQWDFLIKTVTVISDFMDNPPKSDIDLELFKLFVRRDFNSIQVYAYFLKYIERITLSEASFEEQQQDLLYLLKVFKQVRIEEKYVYDPQVQSLKTSVIESISAELNYLEEKEKIYLQSFKPADTEIPSKFYFKVMVTLAELMFLFRIFIEVGFINTKFKSYLYEFVSNHIQTDRSEKPSLKSQRNHFNNKPFPDRTVQSIRNWLSKMIQHIDLYYKITI